MIPAKRLCKGCNKLQAETLFGSDEDPCAYCMANHVQDEEESRNASADDPTPSPTREAPATSAPAPTSGPAMAVQELAQRALARKHLLPFVERFNPKYHAGWVHRDVCRRLEKFSQDVADKKSPRMILQMPPRAGKSTIASIALPAWHLGNFPDHEIISCSYSGSLAMTFSRKVRNMLREEAYNVIFPKTDLDPDSQSAESWLTTAGGGYVAAGVGGGITGKGAHVLIIDDPIKNSEEGKSDIVKEQTRDWYSSTAYTRLAPGGGVLLIMTRWFDADLAGWLIQEMQNGGEKWEVVSYPAIAEEDEVYRDKGEALHPERYPIESLERIRRAVGPRVWSALYQQNPTPDSGDYFTQSMINYYNPQALDHKALNFYQAWDLAIGQNDRNDYTVGVTVGIDKLDNMYIVDVVRGKYSGMQIVERILDSYELWKPSIVGIERGHIEQAIGPFLEKRVKERKLFEAYFQDLKTGRRDKEARARAIQGRLQQGKVLFPKDSAFTANLINEMLRFPHGEHDDQVDALAWIGLMMSDFSTPRRTGKDKKASWKDKLDQLGVKPRTRSAMSA
jgi:predicted phage terminase large subunit-like protein